MASGSGSSGSRWTREQMKVVENALLEHSDDDPDRWEKIATRVGSGKTGEDVKKYYEALVEDVKSIEAGRFDLLNYADDSEADETTKAAAAGNEEEGSAISPQ